MPRRPHRGLLELAAATVACLAMTVTGLPGPAAGAAPARMSPFCQGLGTRFLASPSAWAFCKGLRLHRPPGRATAPAARAMAPRSSANVDAASPAEDLTSAGARIYGQPEASIAASGRYVVEAWNDATGRFSACPSPKAQFTGLGFSSDGGAHFTDLPFETHLPAGR